MFKGILFDFIGTTVIEKDPDVINSCFARAFREHGVHVSATVIKNGRGKDKKEMIAGVLKEFNRPHDLAVAIINSFRKHIGNRLDNFSANPGALEIFEYLRTSNISIGLGSGLPRDIFEQILSHVKWSTSLFDYVGIADEMGRGRPDPVMIFDMLDKCRLRKDEFLKVGDTVADILEGKNANVQTAVILSGTQPEKELREQEPDYVIQSLQELRAIVDGQ